MLTILAPAKVNLTLEVLAKRSDGFHEISSVVQTVNLCDRLRFRAGSGMSFHADMVGWQSEKSLVTRAAGLFRETTGCTKGATIEIMKRIPLLSGLGGDSSDAAAVLCGLNLLWEIGLSREGLLEMAAALGSDVSLFLYGGTARVSGRGEAVTPLPPLRNICLVIMVPPVVRNQGKTGQLYDSLQPFHHTKGQATERLVSLINRHEIVLTDVIESLDNVFEKVAFACFEGLEKYREQFFEAGATNVHLAGSGPALFTLLEDRGEAAKIHRRLRKQGLDAYPADTSEGDILEANKGVR
ncbi:MAG: 4-(cytidine 5'-diphospho)-2-C-methyl-D-erythritol kinase [Chloroflexota bacterium]